MSSVLLPEVVRALVDTVPDAAAVVDQRLSVVHANRQYLSLAGISQRHFAKEGLREACHTRFRLPCEGEGCLTRRAMELGRSIRLDEVASKRDELTVIWVAVPVTDASGAVVGCVELLRDVSAESRMQTNYKGLLEKERKRAEILQTEVKRRTAELQRANDALNRALSQVSTLARTDPLTMLNNRRVFDETLQRELIRSGRFTREVSLLIFDVDHFKHVNDSEGHQAGDALLRKIARLIEGAVRGVDTVARYGGEEFAVILPETPLEAALVAADRIREKQAESGITVSCGVAVAPRHGNTPEALVASADRALYVAKDKGRNRVETA